MKQDMNFVKKVWFEVWKEWKDAEDDENFSLKTYGENGRMGERETSRGCWHEVMEEEREPVVLSGRTGFGFVSNPSWTYVTYSQSLPHFTPYRTGYTT